MKYMKFFQYAYLVFAVLFIYDAIAKYTSEGTIAFMFFFKKKFNKKFENKDPKP